jgi:hypothetical protein
MMSQYLPLDRFKAVYVVDLCHSLCEQAKAKVAAKGWANVHVVEGDACGFKPPEGEASLVTFSYSLSSEWLGRRGGGAGGGRARGGGGGRGGGRVEWREREARSGLACGAVAGALPRRRRRREPRRRPGSACAPAAP